MVAAFEQPVGLQGPTLLLSVDFEDWHQLVRRRVGDPRWREPGPALARQTEALLSLFESLGVRCTFFILGIAARAHPELVRAIADSGHEIGCHGDQHLPVHSQSPREFAADLREACHIIEELTGTRPRGYRAPAFSINRDSAEWAYDVLAAEGFLYDASQCDSFALRGRPAPSSALPHRLPGIDVWEFPVAVWKTGRIRVPVGGASYWSLTPTSLVLRGLQLVASGAGIYLHPNEFDPEPLRALLGPGARAGQRIHARLRCAQRNLARWRAPGVLRAIARDYRLITFGEAYGRLSGGVATRA
jgi:polysaccharide deacetylase family protein (PEP-CTERM system associated)